MREGEEFQRVACLLRLNEKFSEKKEGCLNKATPFVLKDTKLILEERKDLCLFLWREFSTWGFFKFGLAACKEVRVKAFAAQTLCAAIALPAAAIITVGTGFGFIIGHVLDHHIDPPPPTAHAARYLSLALLTALAGILFVTWDYFRQFGELSPSASDRSHRGSKLLPPTAQDGPKPGPISQTESLPQYADEVPMDFVPGRRG